MSLVTPSPGQQWVHNRTQAPVNIHAVDSNLELSPGPVLIYSNADGVFKAMAADRFVHEHYFEAEHAPGADIIGSIRGASKEFGDVFAFHEKFGLIAHRTPGHLSDGKLQERLEFLCEELEEFADAAGYQLKFDLAPQTFTQDLPQQADALVDLVYVALGTAVMLGLPWDALWDDVQAANMRKERGVTKRGHAVDVTKPEGWVGPKGRRILLEHGYNPFEYKNSTEYGAVCPVGLEPSVERSERDDTER